MDEESRADTPLPTQDCHPTLLDDACRLLAFALSTGRSIDDKIISSIAKADASKDKGPLKIEDTVGLEGSYRDLAAALTPVTAATLRATSDKDGSRVIPWAMREQRSEARIWSRKLWTIATFFILVIMFSENVQSVLVAFFPVDEETDGPILDWQIRSLILQSLLPFAYGALGAVAFMLRSAHEHIHQRDFDPLRIPEYYNRLLLGIISGGTITLFVQQVQTDDGQMLNLSAAALGFLAGYNTDFLFKTIERVANAILPKVGIETVRKAQFPLVTPVSLNKLLEQYEKATDAEDKKFLQNLINKLT